MESVRTWIRGWDYFAVPVNLSYKGQKAFKTVGGGCCTFMFIVGFVVFFALGPGSIPWWAAGELFTQGPRAAAISVTVFVNWLGNLIVGLVFPQLQTNLQEFSFVPFLIIVAIMFAILLFYFPETKNRTANDLSLLFQVPNAWTTPIGLKKTRTTSEQPLRLDSIGTYGTNGSSS